MTTSPRRYRTREVRRSGPIMVGLGYAAILAAALLLGAGLIRGLNRAVNAPPAPTAAPAKMRSTSADGPNGFVDIARTRLARAA